VTEFLFSGHYHFKCKV